MKRPSTTRHVVDRRYELLRPAGSGGMATVYEAIDHHLARRVALKILHPHLRSTPLRARFREEGRATARVRHAGIVTIYDTIESAELDAIVMEFVPGGTLRDLLDENGPLPPARAIGIARSLADALGAAHDAGVIHRDIKPSNILITPQWIVKLTDFGIAKQQTPAIDLTTTGTVLGTARYIAPEQLHGREADERSDLYSLATVCYEMLCGSTPFSGGSDATVALARLQSPSPSPRHYGVILSNDVEQTLLRALAANPSDRHPSMRSFGRALAQISVTDAEPRGPARANDRCSDATAVMATAQPRADPPAPLAIGRFIIFAVLIAATMLAVLLIIDSETAQQALDKIFR